MLFRGHCLIFKAAIHSLYFYKSLAAQNSACHANSLALNAAIFAPKYLALHL
jgi:hypothetical protein